MIISNAFDSAAPNAALMTALACPLCRGPLQIDSASATCPSCRKSFGKSGRVFSFISEEMYGSREEFEQASKVIDFWGSGWAKRLREPDHQYLFDANADQLRAIVAAQRDLMQKRRALMTTELDLDSLAGATALNIGCGSGTESLILSVSGAHCVALDITAEAAAAADRLMENAGSAGFGVQGDARYLPIATSSMDVVYSNGVLHHSSDIDRSVAEIHRVLKPGGAAYVMLYAKWSVQFLQERLKGILSGNLSAERQKAYISTHGEGAWQTGSRTNPRTDLFTAAQCRKLFSDFRQVSVRKGDFSIGHVAVVHKFLPAGTKRFLDRYASPRIEPYLGGSMYIRAEK